MNEVKVNRVIFEALEYCYGECCMDKYEQILKCRLYKKFQGKASVLNNYPIKELMEILVNGYLLISDDHEEILKFLEESNYKKDSALTDRDYFYYEGACETLEEVIKILKIRKM